MMWVIWFLVSGWLVLTLTNAWRIRSIRRRWEHAIREQEKWIATTADEFTGFVANPTASQRGGTAVQVARGAVRYALLERMAQAEVNRFLRAEIAGKHRSV